jgi:hypothetical protein
MSRRFRFQRSGVIPSCNKRPRRRSTAPSTYRTAHPTCGESCSGASTCSVRRLAVIDHRLRTRMINSFGWPSPGDSGLTDSGLSGPCCSSPKRRQPVQFCKRKASPRASACIRGPSASVLQQRTSGSPSMAELREKGRGVCVARWYDPGTGEFTSVDPDLAETDQPYAYAGDDPVNSSDPNGTNCFPIGGTGPTPPTNQFSLSPTGQSSALMGQSGSLIPQLGPVPISPIIECTPDVQYPHESRHVSGTVNVVVTVTCTIPGTTSQVKIPQIQIQAALLYSPTSTAPAEWTQADVVQPQPSPKIVYAQSFAQTNASTTCKVGTYVGWMRYWATFPPGYNPPVDGDNGIGDPRYIGSC